MLNQLLPVPRKLFHLSGCTKHWRFPSVSCCKAAPFMESCGSLRVPPEALSVGTCWEQACQCFHKDSNQLCQGDFQGFVSWHRPKCAQTHFLHKEEGCCHPVSVGGKDLQFPVSPQSNFSSALLVAEGSVSLGPGPSWPRAGRWVSLFLQASDLFRAWHKTLPERKAGLCCCWISATPEMLQEGQGRSQDVAGTAAGHGHFGHLTTGNSPEWVVLLLLL